MATRSSVLSVRSAIAGVMNPCFDCFDSTNIVFYARSSYKSYGDRQCMDFLRLWPIDDDEGMTMVNSPPSVADWRVSCCEIQFNGHYKYNGTYPCDPRDKPGLANLDEAALNMVVVLCSEYHNIRSSKRERRRKDEKTHSFVLDVRSCVQLHGTNDTTNNTANAHKIHNNNNNNKNIQY